MARQRKNSSKKPGLSALWSPSPRAALLTLVIATLFVHARALPYPFTNWDDDMLVLRNPQVQNPGNIFAAVPGQTYQPIRLLSYVIDHRIWGSNPMGYHGLNIVLHLAAVLLLWSFLRRWLPDKTDADAIAFLVAFLFAIHPINVESVSWIASRKYGLLAVFMLLALHAQHRRWPIPAALACGLAAMSSPFGIVLPVVLVAMSLRTPQFRLTLVSICVVMAPIIYGIVVGLFGAGGAAVQTPETISGPRLMLGVIPNYLLNLTLPIWLSAKYPYTEPAFKALLGALIIAGAAWGTWRAWRQGHRLALIAVAWAALWWAPVSNLIATSTPMADRYLYLPAIGLFLLLAYTLDCGLRNERLTPQPTRIVLGGYLLGLLVLGALRVGVWSNSIALWQNADARTPNDPIVLSNLGDALETAKRGEEAEPYFRRAIDIWEAHPGAHMALGTFLLRRNRVAESAPHLERAVQLRPERPQAWGNLGIARRELGDAAGAVEAFRQAMTLSRGNIEFHKDLGLAQAAVGDLDGAAATFAALSEATGTTAGLLQAALEFSAKLDHARALPYYQAAIAMTPNDADCHDGLGACLLELGRRPEARPHLERALQLAPGHITAREHLGIMHAAEGQFPDAERIFAALASEHPQRPRAHQLLGMALREQNRNKEAATAMATAGRLAKQPDWLVLAGEFAALHGDNPTAAMLAREALDIHPTHAGAKALLTNVGQ